MYEWADADAREMIEEALEQPTDAESVKRNWDDDEAWADFAAAQREVASIKTR